MAQKAHTNNGVELPKRFARAKQGNCPVCGEPYPSSSELEERVENGSAEEIPGIAYEHDYKVCIEWADGQIDG